MFGFAVPRKSPLEYMPPGADIETVVLPKVKVVGLVATALLKSVKSTVELNENACSAQAEKSSISTVSVNGIVAVYVPLVVYVVPVIGHV